LAFASVMGLVASALVYRVVSQVAADVREPAEEVVVASVNMGLAETVTPRHVKLVAWPRRSVPAGALKTLAEAEGRVVRSSVVAGEPLLEAKLAPNLAGRGGVMPMLVPPGERGVTIKVDDAIKESGFVLPSSKVDVLVSMYKEPGSQTRISKVILQDVLVLAAGQTVELRDNKPVTITTVTLALTPDEAERLALAQAEGKLTLATRNLQDSAVVQTAGATSSTLLGTTPAPAPRVAAAPRPALPPRVASVPLPAPRLTTHTVSVLRAERVSERVFVREAQGWHDQTGAAK
ncbi:MAG TPA: Flp pilus assembly protein CpaB, partial [Vicinamibacteria bacterium]|nr:Flp pilus assembly protein CpaB [Vicinamibacteria bacterium]